MKQCVCFLLLVLLFIVACSKKGNTPDAVAEKFIKAAMKGDFATASKYCTEESKPFLQMAISASSMSGRNKGTFKNVNCQVDEEEGTAICQVLTTENGEESSQEISMVKIDNEWKAVLSKDK
jgi:hypothetical protein